MAIPGSFIAWPIAGRTMKACMYAATRKREISTRHWNSRSKTRSTASAWRLTPSIGFRNSRTLAPTQRKSFATCKSSAALDLQVAKLFLCVGDNVLEFRNPIDGVNRQAEAVDLVFDREFQWRVDISLFLVAAYMHAFMVLPAIGQAMNEPGIAMEVENHRLVYREKRVKIAVGQPVRVVLNWLQLKQVHNIHVTNPQVWKFLTKQHNRRERFLSGSISCRGHDQVRLSSLIVAGLLPDPDSLRAMDDGFIHAHVLEMHLFVADDHVHVVFAPQAVVGDRKERINVGR